MATSLKLSNTADGKRVTFTWGADGNPVFDDSAGELVLSLLNEGAWWADRVGKRQSKIGTVKTRDALTPGRLVQYARDALQPAIDDKRLRSVDPSASASGSGYVLRVAYVTGSGVSGEVSQPLGV